MVDKNCPSSFGGGFPMRSKSKNDWCVWQSTTQATTHQRSIQWQRNNATMTIIMMPAPLRPLYKLFFDQKYMAKCLLIMSVYQYTISLIWTVLIWWLQKTQNTLIFVARTEYILIHQFHHYHVKLTVMWW